MNDRSDDPKASGSTGKSRLSPDSTDVGQPAGPPGGRGGTTSYGGVLRVAPRTKTPEDTPEKQK